MATGRVSTETGSDEFRFSLEEALPAKVYVAGEIQNKVWRVLFVKYRSFASVRLYGPSGLVKEWKASEGGSRSIRENVTLREAGTYTLQARDDGGTAYAHAAITVPDPVPAGLPGTVLAGTVSLPILGEVPVLYLVLAAVALLVLVGGVWA